MITRPMNFRGDNMTAIESEEPEILLASAAGTGKSMACLAKIAYLASIHEKSRHLIVRKTRSSLTETGLVTLESAILEPNCAMLHPSNMRKVRQSYRHTNGAEIIVGGMDKPDKVLSSEYDCVVGETLVDSPSEVQRAYSRPYHGVLITIETAAGYKLTGTPNHPILTDKGWIGLGFLHEGGYVISRRLGKNIPSGANPDIAKQPTPIADVAGALMFAGAGAPQRHETVRMDFHGDATDGYVDVVTSASLLHRRLQIAVYEPLVEDDSLRRDLEHVALMGNSAVINTRFRGDCASVGRTNNRTQFSHPLSVSLGINPVFSNPLISGGKVSLPFSVSIPYITQRLGLGTSTDWNTTGQHFPVESVNANSNTFGDIHNAPFASDVALDRIVKISRADAGRGRHVYNLETRDHWYYANGIISHNCIYVQEATELELEEWETLIGRLRNNRMPYQQIMADCNPTFPHHWLYKRWQAGKIRMYRPTHKDNPRYWVTGPDGYGMWSKEGADYLAKLDRLTGFRRKRFLEGVWAAAEGLVFEAYDPTIHNLPQSWEPPKEWRRYHSIDFGHTNPMVYQYWAEDGDGRLYLYKERYETKRLVEDLAKQVKQEIDTHEPRPQFVVGDHDAEDRATFERHSGLKIRPADKRVNAGIDMVNSRMVVQKDGKPRIFFRERACVKIDQSLMDAGKPTCTMDELVNYVWEPEKDRPVKENDHGADSCRYLVSELDGKKRVMNLGVR